MQRGRGTSDRLGGARDAVLPPSARVPSVGMIRTQKAMITLLDYVENSVPEARLAGDSYDPVLFLPAPPGYAAWVAMRGKDYVAFISRRTPPEQVRHRIVGRWGDHPSSVWQKTGTWLNGDPELSEAWRRHRSQPLPARVSNETTQTRTPAPTPKDEAMPVDPLGYDSDQIMFNPISSGSQVTLRVQISDAAATYIEAAVRSGRFSERQIVEAGSLMFLAHMTGRINILGPEGALFVRRVAEELEDGFDSDAMLATIVRLAETTGLAESAVEMLNQAFPPPGD